jgi:hypothetical protein
MFVTVDDFSRVSKFLTGSRWNYLVEFWSAGDTLWSENGGSDVHAYWSFAFKPQFLAQIQQRSVINSANPWTINIRHANV